MVKPQVSAITIDISNNKLLIGDITKLSTSVEMDYSGAEIPEITCTSSDPSVISVNQEGEIEALGVGEATIKATVGKLEFKK